MRVKVLGCYGADFYEKKNGKAIRYNPSGFLINKSVALDAGTLCGALTLSDLSKVRYVFISHAHLDHIQSLPFMAEILFGKIQNPVVIVSIAEVIEVLRKHFFNGHLWPDFTRLPTPENRILSYQVIPVGKPVEVEGLKITAIQVSHIVPAVGFIVEEDRSAIVYSGDTWKTDELWKVAAQIDHLKAIFVESSFPDQLSQLAMISGHLTPQLTLQEFNKIHRPDLPLYIYHMKPPYLDEIRRQVKGLRSKGVHLLRDGQVFNF
ncbi:3',5'-cyclic-nucleotide phosphodiesterase [Candidatus Manganitrophus noduliformans]|uniref:3',5'-cyclic-nucleotide phosphodiesterase n=1 Tax=Candidatus Manganitrophus noduliformans TaxID=2606439 RepID=A0A7X6DM96_9BACT|nr:3',5'-cyclic-nucleotide phosphodiesterase [Candidatus Manganitrophus noduliformans]NKE69795.1 3',5'-cyclic-nucleotide phosphodiesterase [Candidatus Manganitrophus noduliformans]